MALAKRRERRPGYSCGPNRHTLKGTLWIKDIRVMPGGKACCANLGVLADVGPKLPNRRLSTVTNFFRFRPVISGFIGGPGINTWHGEESVLGFDDEDPQAFAEAVRAFYAAVASYFLTSMSIQFPGEVTWHDEEEGKLVEVFAIDAPAQVAGTGSASNGQLSRATQVVAALNTGVIRDGKRLTGRHFIGPISNGAIGTDGQVLLSARNNIAAAYGGLIDQPGPNLVVWGPPRKSRPATDDLPALPALPGKKGTVQSVLCRSVPGTLRSRKA